MRLLRGPSPDERTGSVLNITLKTGYGMLAAQVDGVVKPEVLAARDDCERCFGAKGGVPGNENVVDGMVLCDYCHSEYMDEKNAQPKEE